MIRRPPRSTLFPYTTPSDLGTTWAGNGSDQLPTPVLFVHPGSNYMLSATGTLNASTSLEFSWGRAGVQDRKSTRLNSSHQIISYAVFCLKKKKTTLRTTCYE